MCKTLKKSKGGGIETRKRKGVDVFFQLVEYQLFIPIIDSFRSQSLKNIWHSKLGCFADRGNIFESKALLYDVQSISTDVTGKD